MWLPGRPGVLLHWLMNLPRVRTTVNVTMKGDMRATVSVDEDACVMMSVTGANLFFCVHACGDRLKESEATGHTSDYLLTRESMWSHPQ